MMQRKNIALVAHDNRKRDLIEWVEWNCRVLTRHHLVCTGTTGRLVETALAARAAAADSVSLLRLKSGPLGGDQQLGAMIAEGRIDFVIFFWDPMEPHPHDVDVKALRQIKHLPAVLSRPAWSAENRQRKNRNLLDTCDGTPSPKEGHPSLVIKERGASFCR